MSELLAENWLLVAIALVIGLLVAWWLFAATRRTRVETDRRDTLDEGAAPAARNQALIDAPPVATRDPAPMPPPAPVGLAGAGTAVAAAVEEAQIEAAEATARAADAETAAVEPEPEPAPSPAPAPKAASTTASADDLTQIKGLGPKLAALLTEMGVTRFEQIAAWDDAEIDRVDAQLGRFQGRIRRDGWVEQAGYLAKGDLEGFRSRFGAT
ncbi:hypothetical protein EB810_04545 [Altererythrobacter sp. FM1]|uniref:NADH dehydrogenase subunit E n=1 Tax=Tsuneonella flava TaxID=2055955 RepID=A0ABX7KE65_9SPHN|nr:hypothetical protein [Tsuneonella flava]QSB45584.1 hypothetical protein IDJ81_05590 [Tsuneonella flava]ROT97178.1 hypothetical protein EB810_04545 [Altererythrobacter sp. FM1]